MTADPTRTPRFIIRAAISDPGHVTPRGDGETELEWKARAVEEALRPMEEWGVHIEEDWPNADMWWPDRDSAEEAQLGHDDGTLVRRLVTPWEEVREP